MCAIGVARVCFVPAGAPWESLGSFGFVWFVRVCSGGRYIRSGSTGSSECALCVERFVRIGLVSLGTP